MKTLLTDIQNRLLTEPSLKYIDEDWGQLDYYMPAAPVKYPCALININTAQYSNDGQLVQEGLITVVITVADIKLSNSSGKAPQLQKQAAWKVFDTLENVYKLLHGWSGSAHYGKLIRTQLNRRKNDDGINLYDMIFTTNLRDGNAKSTYKFTGADPDVKVERL